MRPLLLRLIRIAGVTSLPFAGCTLTRASQVHDLELHAKYPFGEAVAVYRVVLDSLYAGPEQPPQIILYDSTALHTSHCGNNWCTLLPPHVSKVEKSTLRDFEAINRRRGIPMRSDFGYRLPVILSGEPEFKELTKLGEQIQDSVRSRMRPDEMPYWVGFQRKYPGAWGRTALTRVAFNTTRTEALLQVRHGCGGGCASVENILLDKHDGAWRVTERMVFPEYDQQWQRIITIHGRDSVDDYRILGPLRYLGPKPWFRPEFVRREDSARKAVADSLALERAPTRIRGTVINAMTGEPLSHAVVISHSPPNDMKRVVTSDARGSFTFHNLRGGTMLEVRCPGMADAPGTTLAAPGLYAHAAIDTVVQITVPDLLPCWVAKDKDFSSRVRPLTAGSSETAESRRNLFPTGATEDVYHVVLDAILPRRSKAVVISNMTATWCVRYDNCASPQLYRLVAQRVVDSATIRSFIRSNQDSTAIRPSFHHRRLSYILTSAGRTFIADQAAAIANIRSDARENSFWKAFRSAYPGATGIVSLTRVGFNDDTTEALVEARLDSADRAFRPFQMLLLHRQGSTWRVTRAHIEREVTSGAFHGDDCVPVDAPRSLPAAERVADIHGDFLVTKVVTSRNERPTRIHLRLTPHDVVRPKAVYPGANRWTILPVKVEVIDDATGQPASRWDEHFWLKSDGASITISTGGLDGYVEEMTVLARTPTRFFGKWHASLGNFIQLDRNMHEMPNPSGYFCARAIPAKH